MVNDIPQSEVQGNCYVISAGFVMDELLAVLNKKFECELEAAGQFRLVYYDTFDWRLYQKDWLLVLQQGQIQRLSLEKLSNGSVLAVAPVSQPVEAAISKLDIPSSLQEAIAPSLEMRALVPVVGIEGVNQKLLLRDKHGKIVVRLAIEQNCYAWIDNKPKQPLTGRLVMTLVKGYQGQLDLLNTLLARQPGLTVCQINRLDAALQAIGRQACDYSSKVKIKLKPEIQSVQAVKSILQHLLSAMEKNEPGMMARLDTEFLHDYRVAVRRMRSVLSQMKGVLPKASFEFFKKELAWLGAVTTPARDLDVYLLEFEALQASLPDDMRDALLLFRDFLLRQQQRAYKELIEAIKSERYGGLKLALHEFFKSSIETPDKFAPNAGKDIHGQADERIWRSYTRVMKEADSLTPTSPADEFHECRKSCKKLRYLLEFFQNLYSEKDISLLVSQLKILQDNLGEFQDMDVQSHALKEFAKMMEQQGVSNADTFMAMGMLIDSMEQNKIRLQHEFVSCYKSFARQKYKKLFKKMFKPHVKPQQVPAHESVGQL